MTQPLDDRSALTALFASGWEMVEGRDALRKHFKFKSFRSSWAWPSWPPLCPSCHSRSGEAVGALRLGEPPVRH